MSVEKVEAIPELLLENNSNEALPSYEGLNCSLRASIVPEPEIPMEPPLEDEGINDDPMRIYLHQIGQVSLLSAKNEKALSRKIVVGKRINEIKQTYLCRNGRYPSSTELILSLLHEIGQDSVIIQLIVEKLDLPSTAGFKEIMYNPKLRSCIDNQIDQQLVEFIVLHTSLSAPEAEHLLINMSLNSNLLPEIVMNIFGDNISPADLNGLDEHLWRQHFPC
jgi:RNA polymerase primary sigma factor